MFASMTDKIDRFASTVVLGVMLAAMPLAALAFVTDTMGV